MPGIQNNSLEVVVCALPRMMSTFSKKSQQNIQIQAMQSWFSFSRASPHHSHGRLCSLGDNIACPRLQASCAKGDIQEVLPCISLMHNCSYLVQDTSEGPKAANKPRFPYTSQRLKKIYSCPTTHFHQVGGTSVIQN